MSRRGIPRRPQPRRRPDSEANCGWIPTPKRQAAPLPAWLPVLSGPLLGLDHDDLQLGNFLVPAGRCPLNCHPEEPYFVGLNRVSRELILVKASAVSDAPDRLLHEIGRAH